jgi:hypothetical protein
MYITVGRLLIASASNMQAMMIPDTDTSTLEQQLITLPDAATIIFEEV